MNQIIISEKRLKKSVKRTHKENKADEPLISLQRDYQSKKRQTKKLKPYIHLTIL